MTEFSVKPSITVTNPANAAETGQAGSSNMDGGTVKAASET